MANVNYAYDNMIPRSDTRYDIGFSSNTMNTKECAYDLVPNIVAIDCMNRDNKYASTSSDYTISLPQAYRDAISIELVYADVPNGNYNITTNNNKLYINVNAIQPGLDDPVPVPIEITPGLYTLDDLLVVIETAVDVRFAGGDFSVVHSTLTNKITMSSNIPYTLYFQGSEQSTRFRDDDGVLQKTNIYFEHQPQSIAQVIGYRPTNLQSAANSTTGGNVVNIEMEGTISMHIHNLERCDSNNQALDGAFCLIPLDTVSPNFGLLKDGDTIQNDDKTHYFTQPQKLNKLRISFRDWYGNLYDFNGYDHLLIFKIMSLGSSRKYSNNQSNIKQCRPSPEMPKKHRVHKHKSRHGKRT